MIAKQETLIKQILIIVAVFVISTVLTSLVISNIYHSKSAGSKQSLNLDSQISTKPVDMLANSSNNLSNRFLKQKEQQSIQMDNYQTKPQPQQHEQGHVIYEQQLSKEQLKNMKVAIIKDSNSNNSESKKNGQIEYEDVQWTNKNKNKQKVEDNHDKVANEPKQDKKTTKENNFAITIKQDQNLKQYELFKNSNIKFVSANIKKSDKKEESNGNGNKLEVVFNGAVTIKNKK